MIGLQISVQDYATANLVALGKSAQSEKMARSAAVSVAKGLRKKFAELDKTNPNQHGWPRTHFWGEVAKSVTHYSVPGAALVSVGDFRFRQRLEGGAIYPTDSKYLTLPARAEAYAHRAREFKLQPLILKRQDGWKAVAMIEAEKPQFRLPRKSAGASSQSHSDVWYWLVPSVHQQAHPELLPEEKSITDWALNGIDIYFRRVKNTLGNVQSKSDSLSAEPPAESPET